MTANLASEDNAARINQRFAELESDRQALAKAVIRLEATVAQLTNRVDAQHNIIAQLMAGAFGPGPTEETK